MEPHEFIGKWKRSDLKERSAAQEHFIDLCRLLGEPTPAEADPTGDHYCFERGARKESGGAGWANVWKRNHFAWEYKGKKANLDAAFQQLRQYAPALENPPLLIVSDMSRVLIRTNWTDCVSKVYRMGLDDLADASVRQILKWAFSDPERLRPEQTRTALTEAAAVSFATLAHELREAGLEPHQVARFVNRIVFCLFAEDTGLLPGRLFNQLRQVARRHPEKFREFAQQLFGAMATGGWMGLTEVSWFDGGVFDDDRALPLTMDQVELLIGLADLDWSEIDPSILGTFYVGTNGRCAATKPPVPTASRPSHRPPARPPRWGEASPRGGPRSGRYAPYAGPSPGACLPRTDHCFQHKRRLCPSPLPN